MANEKNLKPIKKGQLSKEEAKRRGSKGGKKSAEVRKARKTFSEDLIEALSDGETQKKILDALNNVSKGILELLSCSEIR